MLIIEPTYTVLYFIYVQIKLVFSVNRMSFPVIEPYSQKNYPFILFSILSLKALLLTLISCYMSLLILVIEPVFFIPRN